MLKKVRERDPHKEYVASFIVLVLAIVICLAFLFAATCVYRQSFSYAIACIVAGSVLSFIIKHVLAPSYYDKKKRL